MTDRPLANSYWVQDQRLLAGDYPLLHGGDEHQSRVALLLAAGIDCFIDLTEPDEVPPYDAALPAAVAYLRKPIPDHDVPRQFSRMREIQNELAAALAAGRHVYLHCRAGIGRTGTVVGCFLVEQGLDGEAALAELNRLWQQSKRSASWLTIPQTPEQEDYVRNWVKHRRVPVRASDIRGADAVDDPVPSDSALAVVGTLRERYLGALLGLAIGDALAAATQFRRPGSFTPVGDLLGGGPYDLPRGAWSDDTAMALCLADSLVAIDRFDTKDQVARYLRWQTDGYLSATGQCLGITASTAKALAASQWRRQPYAGSHDPTQLDPEPLSRVAPAVLHAFADTTLALEQAANAARTTCQAPLVLDCCRLLGAMLLAALRGEPRARVLSPALSDFGDRPLRAEVGALIATPPALPTGKLTAGADVLAALQTARWAFGSTDSFRAGALAGVNCGGNADVVGAVYGQLAGAYYGINAIPRSWRSALALGERIEALADQLLALALVRLGNGVVAR